MKFSCELKRILLTNGDQDQSKDGFRSETLTTICNLEELLTGYAFLSVSSFTLSFCRRQQLPLRQRIQLVRNVVRLLFSSVSLIHPSLGLRFEVGKV